MKRNTALHTYKSSFTLDIFPHAHSLTASCWCFVTDLPNQHHACMCCSQNTLMFSFVFPDPMLVSSTPAAV
jgi:hypothetical protein